MLPKWFRSTGLMSLVMGTALLKGCLPDYAQGQAVALTPPVAKPTLVLTLTPLQQSNLKVAQLQFALASKNVQEALQEFYRVCAVARTENKWPEGTQCTLQDLSIVPPKADAAKADAAKADAPKEAAPKP